MPESLTPELLALAATAERFAKEHLLVAEAAAAAGRLSARAARAEVVAAAQAAGLYRMTQPLALGGSAAGPLALVVAREALARQNPANAEAVFGPSPGILAEVGEPLASTHLRPLLDGDRRAGFGFTEPAEAAAYSRAERRGQGLVVNGHKSYVSRGAEADFINVLVDVGDEGRAFVVVDTDAPGVVMERAFETLDGARHAAFRFEGVQVPASHLVGTPGDGSRRALDQIGATRLQMSADAVGRACWVIDYLTAHLRMLEAERGARDSLRLRYAALRLEVYAARAVLYRAARRAQSVNNAVNEVMAAKVLSTESLGRVVDTAMQLVGGGALVVDHPLAVLHRTVRSARVAEGLSDVLLLNMARGALELNRGTL